VIAKPTELECAAEWRCSLVRLLKTLIVVVAVAADVSAQVIAKPAQPVQHPSPIKLSRNAEGELSATAPFTLRSAPGFPTAEVAIEPQAGTLRITCSWDTSARLQVSVTAAAGHGLPGRINLGSQIGESPHTLEVQVSPSRRHADLSMSRWRMTPSNGVPRGWCTGLSPRSWPALGRKNRAT